MGKRELIALHVFFVFMVYCDCCVAFRHDAREISLQFVTVVFPDQYSIFLMMSFTFYQENLVKFI